MTNCDCCKECGTCDLVGLRKSSGLEKEISELRTGIDNLKADTLSAAMKNPELMKRLSAADLEKLENDRIEIPKSSIVKGKSLKELSAYEIDRMCD